MKPEIHNFIIIQPRWAEYFLDYIVHWPWNFYRTFRGIHYYYIKKIFVNPDLGKQGRHTLSLALVELEFESRRGAFTRSDNIGYRWQTLYDKGDSVLYPQDIIGVNVPIETQNQKNLKRERKLYIS